MTATRTETDSFGPLEVPADKYWGAQTQRSIMNFPIGWERQPKPIIRALGVIKKAAALVNKAQGDMDAEIADAIVAAQAPQLLRKPQRLLRTLLAALFFSVFMQSFHTPAGASELHFIGAMPIYLTLGFVPTLLGFGLGLLLGRLGLSGLLTTALGLFGRSLFDVLGLGGISRCIGGRLGGILGRTLLGSLGLGRALSSSTMAATRTDIGGSGLGSRSILDGRVGGGCRLGGRRSIPSGGGCGCGAAAARSGQGRDALY